jgi:hypothetical protein
LYLTSANYNKIALEKALIVLALSWDFLLPFDDICNIGDVMIFPIYAYLAATCDYGMKSQDQYFSFFYKNITIDRKFSIQHNVMNRGIIN